MNYEYRKADGSALNGIMEVYRDAQRFMESNGNPQWQKGFPSEDDVRGGIFGGLIYVVLSGGEIAAVFSAVDYDRDYDEISGKWLTEGNNYLAVHRVAVSDKFRGHGAAKFVINAAAEIASSRGKTSLRFDTHEKNIPMRTLLKTQGFTECGTIQLFRDETSRIAFEKII
ncbi:MAG: GNAT family N-acetyltransferase [Clostridia bacterium]|nr:GNAT family N-acetyltransferase [Clostridia bacterium]